MAAGRTIALLPGPWRAQIAAMISKLAVARESRGSYVIPVLPRLDRIVAKFLARIKSKWNRQFLQVRAILGDRSRDRSQTEIIR